MMPLRKLLGVAKQYKSKHEPKVVKKVIRLGKKTAILTATSTISTVILVLLVVMTGIGIFSAPDAIVNSICMMLMTPYHHGKKLDKFCYHWCCSWCKKLCQYTFFDLHFMEDENKLTVNLADNSINTTDKTLPLSVDTMSQLRHLGQTVKMVPDYSHNDRKRAFLYLLQ